jgi:hypothetical protein
MTKELKKDEQGRIIDETLNIPQSVRDAAARADALHKAVYNPEKPAEGAPAPAAEVTPQGNPEGITEVTPAPAPAAAAPAPAPAPAKTEDWEHKFNSMKGRFDRSESERRKLNDRLAGMEQVIATMQTPTEPEKPAELDPASMLTAAEREAYGDEFISTVAKVAGQNPEVTKLKNELQLLKAQLTNVDASLGQSARDRMHDLLTSEIPNWLEVNKDPKFSEWLALTDVYSGAIKHELLKSAYAANDGPRVLNFFKGFLAEEAALVPPTTPAPTPEVNAGKVPLESLAAPGRAKTAAAAHAPAEKPIYSRAFVTQFYSDCARGVYRGRDDEKNRIDASIIEAGRERRIR